jgi:hypothetical protein
MGGGAAHAASVTLNFDRLPDGSPVVAPAVFSSTEPVREQLAGFGVHFGVPSGSASTIGGGGVLSGSFGVAGYSGANYLAFSFNPAAHYLNGQNPQPPQLLHFDHPARVVRLNVGGFGGTARLTALDSAGTPIAEATLRLGSTVAPLEVHTPGFDIHSVSLRFEGSLAGIADDLVLEIPDAQSPPVTHCALEGTPGANGWYLGDVHVTLSAEDSDGSVQSTLYRLDGGEWQPYAGPVLVTGEGPHTVEYRSVDNLGTEEAAQLDNFKIDTGAPAVDLRLTRWFLWPCNGRKMPVQVLGSASDTGSGLAGVTFEVEDEYGAVEPPLTQFGQTIMLQARVMTRDRDGRIYRVTATATDNAGQKRAVTQYVLVPRNLGNCRRTYARLLVAERKKQ